MQIAIVLYPGFTALDAVGPYEVLHLMPDAEVCFVGHEVGPVLADSGILSITATKSFDEITAPDIVPGELNRHRDRDERPHTPAVAQAGSRHHHMDYLSVHRRLDSRRRRHPARTTGHYTLDDAVGTSRRRRPVPPRRPNCPRRQGGNRRRSHLRHRLLAL